MVSVEEDLLTGLCDLLQPLTTATGTLFQLSDGPDEQFALSLSRGATDPFGRWGQAVLLLLTRGSRSQPLTAHAVATPLVNRLITVAGATFGSVGVTDCQHRGSSSGPDSSKRTVRADTFSLELDYQA